MSSTLLKDFWWGTSAELPLNFGHQPDRRGKDSAHVIGVFRGVVIFELETALGDCVKMVIARLHGRLSLAYAHGRRSRCISTAFTAMPVPMPRTQ